jgi:hypothetical protein
MNAKVSIAGVAAALVLMAGGGWISGQQLPSEPPHEAATSITGAFEGWFPNADGTFSLLLGYNNRNLKQELDIPIGPNNHIDPGGPDRGQPTHFLTGRQWGLFVVKVPKDFGKNKISWTIVANGHTTVIPASLHRDYQVSPFMSTASAVGTPSEGDTPPILRFEEHGPSVQGPLELVIERAATVSAPLPLTVWVADDTKIFTNSGATANVLKRPAVMLKWSTYRGAGPVVFAKDRPPIEKAACHDKGMVFCGSATTTATFSEPGDYTLSVVANDYSGEGGGGFQCCWSTGKVKVKVSSGTSAAR